MSSVRQVVIDLHAHVLPGLDDGPEDLAESLALARAAVAAGTRRVAATSHVDHTFGLDVADFAGARAALQAVLDRKGIELEVVAGGELALTRLPELDAGQLREITLGGGGTVLLEPPFSPAGHLIENAVFALQRQGFRVLLAHPERSPDFGQHLDDMLALVDRGVHLQLTAASLSGAYGRHVQELSEELLRRRVIHVIASDAHAAEARTPDITKHLDAAAGRIPELGSHRDYFVEEAPAAILRGEAPRRPPVVRTRRRRLARLLAR